MNKLKFKTKYIIIFIISLLLCPIIAYAQKIEIYDISPNQLESKRFILDKRSTLKIEAAVGEYRLKDDLLSNCWILNIVSHEVVWEFSRRKAKRSRSRKMLSVEETVKLPKGHYEIFYALNPLKNVIKRKILGLIFDSDSRKYYSPDWGITIQPDSRSEKYFSIMEKQYEEKQTIVQITNVYDDEYHKKGFSLTAPVKLRIYALGEGTQSGRKMFDFAWISDVNSRERIWEMKYRKTEHAGGAKKNRKFEGRLTLPAGDYMVHYVTDDSHSTEEWNQMPPYDPSHWGITIWAEDIGFDYTEIKSFNESDYKKPVVEITRMRNNRYESQGFQLRKKAKLHIFALGESSHSRRNLADYGWIIDATNRKTIWKMNYNDTEYAGGGKKNRVFDGFVTLPAGKYFACYRTDDSHAFRSWNVDAPWMPESWGITISCADKECEKNIQLFDELDDADVLVQMIRMRDDEKTYQRFELTIPTYVRIYAIGEGRSGKMFDYGWIENQGGDKVWKMKYSNTKHAGGGTKNRIINEVIKLQPGKYSVYYRTDDSHSYQSWNTTPPDDAEHWGIMIIRQPK